MKASISKRGQALQRRTVAIHAVEAFDHDADAPGAAFGAPARYASKKAPTWLCAASLSSARPAWGPSCTLPGTGRSANLNACFSWRVLHIVILIVIQIGCHYTKNVIETICYS